MRVYTVKKARKDQGTCESCREPINAGMAYKYVAPRYGPKRKRHQDCPYWKQSELTSGKIATAYAAQEDAHEALESVSWPDEDEDPVSTVESDIQEILSACAEGAQECMDDYQEGLDAMPEGLQYGPVGEEIQAKIDALSEWIDSLGSWSPDGYPETVGDACNKCGLSYTDGDHEVLEDGRFSKDGHYFVEEIEADPDWVIELIESAKEAVDSLEL